MSGYATHMRRPARDPKTIAPLLAALVPLGLTACDSDVSDGDGGPSPIGSFDASVCLQQEDGLSDLQPTEGTDYVALRRAEDYGQPPEEVVVAIVSDWGTACESAADAGTCSTDVAELPLDEALASGGLQVLSNYDVLYTDGDGAGLATTKTELLALLGSIDTANEAALVAFAEGHDLRCGEDNVRNEDGSYVLLGTKGTGCGEGDDRTEFEVTVSESGDVSVGESIVVEKGDPNCAIGRRPEALRSRSPEVLGVGEFFASMAHLEAASVPAFAQLARELAAHGAPADLVQRTLVARDDEVRHTRVTRRLARRFGGDPVRPEVGRSSQRALFDMALDNATEGCVRETFGALVAKVQAERAADPEVRAALAEIAEDETRHAELSWEIDRWVRSRLSDEEEIRLDAAQREAANALQRDVAYDWPDDVRTTAGMPDAATSAELARAFSEALALS